MISPTELLAAKAAQDHRVPDEAVDRIAELAFVSISDLADRVDNTPHPGWLIEPVWPADSYGVIAAQDKAGKTWASLDLAVSVASGTPWMGVYPCRQAGPVLMFLGEGGERKMLRRLRAVCAARGLTVEDLPIRLCFRVPHLTDKHHLAEVEQEVVLNPPRLVILDPLYLAARGAHGSDLFEMGAHLERLQHVAQRAKAALVVIHHWNKTGEGKGANRMSGVGPGAWGRVLVSVAVESNRTDEATGETMVSLGWKFTGDEIPDTSLRICRRVWADDPKDLNSPLNYEVTRGDSGYRGTDPELADFSPAVRRVLLVLRACEGWRGVQAIGDKVAEDGTGYGLKPRTIQAACKELVAMGLIELDDSNHRHLWRAQLHAQDELRIEVGSEEIESAF